MSQIRLMVPSIVQSIAILQHFENKIVPIWLHLYVSRFSNPDKLVVLPLMQRLLQFVFSTLDR